MAIVDEQGVILETNRAWQEFGRDNGLEGPPDSEGINYLAICAQASRDGIDQPAIISRGIRAVIAGEINEFFTDYPCHSPGEQRWYALRVVPFREPQGHKVIMTHENITPIIQAQEALKAKEKEVRHKAMALEEANVALKVLLRHREQDKKDLEDNVLANVRQLVQPYVEKLMASRLPPQERTYVAIINDRLGEIISPFLNRLSALHSILTPQEIQVATMVREGRSSEEIADALLISTSGVAFHRKKIRQKLGLTNTKTNLRSALLNLHQE
jgi:DNA-binding CsgD family transcriptional regulator